MQASRDVLRPGAAFLRRRKIPRRSSPCRARPCHEPGLRAAGLRSEQPRANCTEKFSGIFARPGGVAARIRRRAAARNFGHTPNQAVSPPERNGTMKTRTAAPVLITASLVVLMSGCAGAAAQGGQVSDDLRPAANAAAVGLARGHVIVRDDISPTPHVRGARSRRERVRAGRRRRAGLARQFSADARREFHATSPQQAVDVTTAWSADARRELHAGQPGHRRAAVQRRAIRELKRGRAGRRAAAVIQRGGHPRAEGQRARRRDRCRHAGRHASAHTPRHKPPPA